MSQRKGRAVSRHAEPTASLGYATDLTGPQLKLYVTMEYLPDQGIQASYDAAGLRPSYGHRVGHHAYLTMDQQHLCVMGGRVLQEEEVNPTTIAASLDVAQPTTNDDNDDVVTPADCVLCRPEEAARLPTALTSCYALLECYALAERAWYVPARQLRATASDPDAVSIIKSTEVRRGVPRWPTQAGYAVVPDPVQPRALLEESSEAESVVPSTMTSGLSTQQPGRLRVAVDDTDRYKRTADVVKGELGLGHDGDKSHDVPSGAAARVETSAAPDRVVADALDAGPMEIYSIGGWNGHRRVNALLTYTMAGTGPVRHDDDDDAVACDGADADGDLLPTVHELAELPALCHHSCTTIRDTVYCFGGEGVRGSTSGLYLLHSPTLRVAYAEYALADAPSSTRRSLFAPTHHTPLYSYTFGSTTASGAETAAEGWSCVAVTAGSGTGNDLAEPAARSARTETVTSVAARTVARSPSVGVQESVPAAPPPSARACHAACALSHRFLVVFGGRRVMQGEELGVSGRSGGSARVARHGPAPPTTTARTINKKTTSGRASGSRSASRGRTALAHEEPSALPPPSLCNDVAVFDVETQSWVGVRIAGCQEVPVPRYGAALCAVPVTSTSTGGTALLSSTTAPFATSARATNAFSSSMLHSARRGTTNPLAASIASVAPPVINPRSQPLQSALGVEQREVVMHGGVDAQGRVLRDAWLLHITSKSNPTGTATLLEPDPKTGVATLTARWIALPCAHVQEDHTTPHSTATPSTTTTTSPRESKGGKGGGVEELSGGPEWPARAHHVLVANTAREVYVIGGTHVGDDGDDAVAPTRETGVVVVRVPPLHQVVSVERPASAVRKRSVSPAMNKRK